MLLINIIGIILIGFIIWWFWLYKPATAKSMNNDVAVVVENGVYSPANIALQEGQPAHLRFLRKDASPCAEMVVFPTLDINAELPLKQEKDVVLPALKKGEYTFHCQMQMYRGKLTVQ